MWKLIECWVAMTRFNPIFLFSMNRTQAVELILGGDSEEYGIEHFSVVIEPLFTSIQGRVFQIFRNGETLPRA